MSDKRYKHCMFGEPGVGKTSILLRYVEDKFYEDKVPTLGKNNLIKQVESKGSTIYLNIWDTTACDRFSPTCFLYFRGVTSCMIVYDVTNRESFEDVEGYVKHVKCEVDNPNISLFLYLLFSYN